MNNMNDQKEFEVAKKTFNEINNFSSKTELVKLSIDEIISEIKIYRHEKKLLNK
jgi:hypothetical protein